jgi:hypothetical protein
MTEQRKWDSELIKCPDCGVALNAKHIEFVENGIAQRDVYCPTRDTDCTFETTEVWKMVETKEYETSE